MKNPRQLNIEVLRILAMLLILLWHVNGHYIQETTLAMPSLLSSFWGNISCLNTFHVDLFVLITGYFGIKHYKKNILRIWLLVFFYSIALYLVVFLYSGNIDLTRMLMPIGHSEWWFMTTYFALLLLTPILEFYILHGICNCRKIVLVTTFINVYYGFFAHVWNFNHAGYDIINFVNMYSIGAWLRMEGLERVKKFKCKFFVGIIIMMSCMIAQYILSNLHTKFFIYSYNSPYAIVMSMCLFVMTACIQVNEKYRNIVMFFSSSSVAAYLITDFGFLSK